MSQVKNRRENIFIDKPPVEIPTIDAIEIALDSDGYVKAEDLPIATDEVAGMVKIGEGVSVTEDGTISVQNSGGSGTVLWSEGETPTAGNETIELSDYASNYNALIIICRRSDGSHFMTTVVSTEENAKNISDVVNASGTPGSVFILNISGKNISRDTNSTDLGYWYKVIGI